MKPSSFQYHGPQDLDEACGLLAGLENVKVLAGGQSLIPLLNRRLESPDHLIDLNGAAELSYIRETGKRIEIGAMTRYRELESSPVIQKRCPLMIEALQQIGHRQTRNRGTIGGSLSYLHPAAELPVVAATLDASLRVHSVRGPRTLTLDELLSGDKGPAIAEDEIITALEFEPWPQGHGYAFVEYVRRHGDFALASAAVMLELGGDGTAIRSWITLGGVSPKPRRMNAAEAVVIGSQGDVQTCQRAAKVCREIDTMGDVHASPAYRRHLGAVLCHRALELAFTRASSPAGV